MSRKAQDWAYRMLERGGVAPSAAYTLLVLANHHNPKHGCFPSQKALSERLGLTERQVRRNLEVLVRHKLISLRWKRTGGREYVLNFEARPPGRICPVRPDIDVQKDPPEEGGPGRKCPVPLKQVTQNLRETVSEVPNSANSGSQNPGNPGQDPEEESTMKAEDVIAATTKAKTDEEILARITKAESKPAGVTPGVLGKVWVDLFALHLPQFGLPAISFAGQKQLHLAYKQAGHEFVHALVDVFRNWQKFRSYCDSVEVFPPIGKFPEAKFILANVQHMVVFHRERQVQLTAPKTPPVVAKKPLPVEPAPVQTSAPPATLAEIEAILGISSGP